MCILFDLMHISPQDKINTYVDRKKEVLSIDCEKRQR